jgi:hypothetical protein
MSERQFVDRPATTHGGAAYDVDGLVATAKNGKALIVPIGKRKVTNVRATLWEQLRHRGYKLHAIAKDDHLVAWCEPLGPKEVKK